MSTPAATTGWVAEATYQFRLAVAWQRLATALDRPHPPLAAAVRERVLGHLFTAPWFPGIVRGLVAKAERAADYPNSWWHAVAGRLVAEWPTAGVSDTDALDLWKKALQTNERATALPPDPPGRWPEWVNPLAWVNTAVALEEWAAVAAELGTIEAPAGGLMTQAVNLKKSADPNVVAFATNMLDWLNKTTARDEYELCQAVRGVRDVLAQCPADWPPRVVQSLYRRVKDAGGELVLVGKPNTLADDRLAARVGLITALADALHSCDSTAPGTVSPAVRDVLTGVANRLLDGCGAAIAISWEYNPHDPHHQLTPAVKATFLQCEQPQIEVRSSDGRRLHTVPGLFVGPPRVPPLVSDLRAAAEPPTDPAFADLCRELAALWKDGLPPVDAPLDDDLRDLLWRLTVRATLRRDEAGAVVLNALEKVGVRAEVVTAAPDLPPARWVVVPDPSTTAHGTTAAVQLAIRFRDHPPFAPTVCLRVASSGRKVVDLLARIVPLVNDLRRRDPEWGWWGVYDEQVLRVAYATPATAPAEDVAALDRTFEAAYRRRGEDVPDGTKAAYTALATTLYECVREYRPNYPLDLDPNTFLPFPLPRGEPDPLVKVRWAAGDTPRAVQDIINFPRGNQPAELKVSVGQALTPLLAWLALTDPPAGPLVAWARMAAELPWQVDEWPAAEVHVVQQRIAEWLREGGEGWFDRAVRDDHPWATQLLAAEWCQCHPRREGESVVWDGDPLADGLRWEFSTHPSGHAIREVKYATTPDRAGGVFSLGPPPTAPTALSLAHQLAGGEPAVPEAVAVSHAERRRHFGRPADVATDLLGLGERWADLSPAGRQLARDWAAQHHGRFVTDAPAAADVRFDDTLTAGETRVLECGVELNGRELRAVKAFRSAGPLPHYDALRREVTGHAPALLAALDEWPRLALNGTLRDAVVVFYERFWEQCGRHPAPAPFTRAADELKQLLAEAYGVSEFTPTRTDEKPDDWLQQPPNAQVNFHAVRTLRRPGLVNRRGEKVLPAIASKVE